MKIPIRVPHIFCCCKLIISIILYFIWPIIFTEIIYRIMIMRDNVKTRAAQLEKFDNVKCISKVTSPNLSKWAKNNWFPPTVHGSIGEIIYRYTFTFTTISNLSNWVPLFKWKSLVPSHYHSISYSINNFLWRWGVIWKIRHLG